MYSVQLMNFGTTREFQTLEAALTWARSTGFECAIWAGSEYLQMVRP
jgi:hypothetical protein